MKRSLSACALTLWAAALILAPSLFAQAKIPSPRVVASTSWTAAIARAAGATDIVVIAPMELQHPPEYEIKPSDLAAVRDADFVLYSGYERFAARLAETSAGSKTRVLQVYTDNLPTVFKQEARKVAEAMGTLDAYGDWEREFDRRTEEVRRRIAAAYPDRRAAVHKFLATQAEWLGFEVVGTFGPGEPSPKTLLDLSKAKPAVVIDNWHSLSGAALAESVGCPYVTLINFPGKGGTVSIDDVFDYNAALFMEARSQAAVR